MALSIKKLFMELKKYKSPRKKLRNPEQKEDLIKYINYLKSNEITEEISQNKKFFRTFYNNLKIIFQKIHKKGKKKITVMFIPHSESRTLSLNFNYYTLFITSFLVLVIIITSTSIMIYRNAQNMEYYDIGITNKHFYLQTSRLGTEIIPMYKNVIHFAENIIKIHKSLSIQSENPKGGISEKITQPQLEALEQKINICKEKKEQCEKETIKEILDISLNLSLLNNQIIKELNEKVDEISKEMNSSEFQNFFKHIPLGLPVNGSIKYSYKTKFSIERGTQKPITGIEISTFPNTPVRTLASGKVVEINYNPYFGLYLWIEHLPGLKTFYGHLGEVIVKKNENIEKGKIIGYTGKTGFTNKNILYYEIHIGNMVFNPHILINDVQMLWLNQQKY